MKTVKIPDSPWHLLEPCIKYGKFFDPQYFTLEKYPNVTEKWGYVCHQHQIALQPSNNEAHAYAMRHANIFGDSQMDSAAARYRRTFGKVKFIKEL